MVPAPCDYGRVFLGGIGDVVGGVRALGVALALGVPGQANRLRTIGFGRRQWW